MLARSCLSRGNLARPSLGPIDSWATLGPGNRLSQAFQSLKRRRPRFPRQDQRGGGGGGEAMDGGEDILARARGRSMRTTAPGVDDTAGDS